MNAEEKRHYSQNGHPTDIAKTFLEIMERTRKALAVVRKSYPYADKGDAWEVEWRHLMPGGHVEIRSGLSNVMMLANLINHPGTVLTKCEPVRATCARWERIAPYGYPA